MVCFNGLAKKTVAVVLLVFLTPFSIKTVAIPDNLFAKNIIILQVALKNMRFFLPKTLFIIFTVIILQGCETLRSFKFSDSSPDSEYADWDAKKFYTQAKIAMEEQDYQKATTLYQKLKTRYPFSHYATQAQLDIVYVHFKNKESESVIAAADSFIKTHPSNPHVDYAYYLKGLVNFNRDIGFIDRFLPTDASQRNPSNIKEAYASFQDLLNNFPDSQYAPDAKQRMLYLKNNQAMYEVHVARFYLKRKAYVAAANRGNYVIKEFQHTPATAYALQIMQVAYTKLGLHDLAADATRVYQENFPDGPPVPEYHQAAFVYKIWDYIGFDR